MGDLLKYDDRIINSALDVCQQFITDIDKLVDDAQAAVTSRMNVSEGAYSGAFTAANQRWEQAQTLIHQTVGNFAGALARASETMSATDRRWAQNFDAIG